MNVTRLLKIWGTQVLRENWNQKDTFLLISFACGNFLDVQWVTNLDALRCVRGEGGKD